MSSDEIEEFGNTRGINPFVPTKARGDRMRRIAKVDQCYRELFLLELLRSKTIQRGLRRSIDEVLQRNLLSNGLEDGNEYQSASGQEGSDVHAEQINMDLTQARKMCYNRARAEQT